MWGALKHPGFIWSVGESLMYADSPIGTILLNVGENATVYASALSEESPSENPKEKQSRLGRLFRENFKPNILNATFWAVNMSTKLLQLKGVLPSEGESRETLKMKALYAGLSLGFYGAIGLSENPRIAGWLKKQGAFAQATLKQEMMIAPSVPIFFGYYLGKIGPLANDPAAQEGLFKVLCGWGAVVAITNFKTTFLNTKNHVENNLGMYTYAALCAMAEFGHLDWKERGLMGAYAIGNLIWLHRNRAEQNKCGLKAADFEPLPKAA
jgi:hypothetical protein